MSTIKIPHHFLIIAPAYSDKSGGVMILHDLCNAINKCGHKATIAFISGGDPEKQNFTFGYSNETQFHMPGGLHHPLNLNSLDSEISDILTNGTIIYPDLINENPLQGKRVIRFILNKNEMPFPNEYILSYSEIFYNQYNFALPKPFISPFLHGKNTRNWSERNLNLTYIGKGFNFTESFRIPGSILVERNWPRDKEQLGLLLQQCKFFFTWDCVSATNYDAALCGAVPVLLHDKQIPRKKINEMEFGKFPEINYTINSNQELEIEPIDKNKISKINEELEEMKSKMNSLESSWVFRVGCFLNDYILFLHHQSKN